MKVTNEFEKLLRVLHANPRAKHWGYDLMKATDLKSGTLYPMLDRLKVAGYLTSDWAEPDGDDPRRKYYQLTESGEKFCRTVLAAIDAAPPRRRHFFPYLARMLSR